MVSFELCKEMFFCLVTIVRQRKTKLEHQSMESKALRFDSSWGLRIFSLSHTCDMKKHLSLFLLCFLFCSKLACYGHISLKYFLSPVKMFLRSRQAGYSNRK